MLLGNLAGGKTRIADAAIAQGPRIEESLMPDDAEDYAGLRAARWENMAGQPIQGHCGCRYYGMAHVILASTGRLVSQLGNECAVVFDAYAPCKMEIGGLYPDEQACDLAQNYKALAMRREEL
jgi:hypothetical protein